MKKLIILSVITSALMAPVLVSAATTAELKLIGTITPSACVPNFTGGSTIDYGNIAASTLNSSSQTTLPEKTTKFSVVCDSPVKFAYSVTDERSASVVESLETIPNYSNAAKLGLGTADDGTKIGAYSMQTSNETPGSGATQRLNSSDGGSSWVNNNGAIYPGELHAFADSSSSTSPGAFESMVIDVRVVAAIDKASNLPITDEITIDGLSTFEVKYL